MCLGGITGRHQGRQIPPPSPWEIAWYNTCTWKSLPNSYDLGTVKTLSGTWWHDETYGSLKGKLVVTTSYCGPKNAWNGDDWYKKYMKQGAYIDHCANRNDLTNDKFVVLGFHKDTQCASRTGIEDNDRINEPANTWYECLRFSTNGPTVVLGDRVEASLPFRSQVSNVVKSMYLKWPLGHRRRRSR